MTFKEIFKRSFLEGFSRYDSSPVNVAIIFAITFLCSAYIYGAYRILTKNTFYSKSFNTALPLLTMITAAVIVTIQSSVVISLGMVGALSIVRFRTAIKEPVDLVFLFWSISTGIICGAGLAEIAVILAIGVTLVLLATEYLPAAKSPQILNVSVEGYQEENRLRAILYNTCTSYSIKSKSLANGIADYVIELKTKDDAAVLEKIAACDKVIATSLLNHAGEITL